MNLSDEPSQVFTDTAGAEPVFVVEEPEVLAIQDQDTAQVVAQVVEQELFTIDEHQSVFVEDAQDDIGVLEGAQQGPQGIQGPGGSLTETYTAGVTLSGNTVVKTQPDGSVIPASADDPASAFGAFAVTTTSAPQGNPIVVQGQGPISYDGWNWIKDEPVFLGLNGLLTQTVPLGALFDRVVGSAITPQTVQLNFHQPIFHA